MTNTQNSPIEAMSMMDHLRELRMRLVRSALAIGVSTLLLFPPRPHRDRRWGYRTIPAANPRFLHYLSSASIRVAQKDIHAFLVHLKRREAILRQPGESALAIRDTREVSN